MRKHAAAAGAAERSGRTTHAQATPAGLESLEPRLLFAVTPNDPQFRQQWGMAAANTTAAWDVTTGSAKVVVGHVDTGLDYNHPDLARNVWINQAEIPAAVKRKLVDADKDGRISFWDLNDKANAGKVRDVNRDGAVTAGDLFYPYKADGTGGWADGVNGKSNPNDRYVDDIIGWDFADNDNKPMDYAGHGTHTAGVIGAVGNNRAGVSGVAWKTSLIALKVFRNNGTAVGDDRIAAAVRYAVDNGAKISNNSYGGYYGEPGDALHAAFSYANSKGHLAIVAAGNDGVDNDSSYMASFPSTYDLPNIVSVAAVNSNKRLPGFSNWGRKSVDLAAPGDGILSTWTRGGYGWMNGTSMAAPHVTGTAALMLSRNPNLNAAQLKAGLLNSADATGTLSGKALTGGRLNVARAVQLATSPSITGTKNPTITAAKTTSTTTTRTTSSAVRSVRMLVLAEPTASRPVDGTLVTATLPWER